MNCEETVWETCTAAGIGGHNMLILVMLARENDSGPDGGWLTRMAVARRTALSTKTVQSYLQSLYDAGLVARKFCTRENGASLPTLYRINMNPGQQLALDYWVSTPGERLSGTTALESR